MTRQPERVVFDCNVYFQAFLSEQGPAGQLLQAVQDQRLILFASQYVLDELEDILARPAIVARFKFTRKRVAKYLEELSVLWSFTADVPPVFEFPRDPKDAHYVDLAIAVEANLIVSRDKDLLSLMDAATPEGREFANRFPTLQILTPPSALQLISAG